MKVKSSILPSGSLTKSYLPVDYTDVFVCAYTSSKNICPDDVLINLLTDMPACIGALFKLRDILVRLVGLKPAANRSVKEFEHSIRTGGTYGFTSVTAKADNETVLLLTDKHLNAYLSIHIYRKKDQQKASLITLVKFNNKLGRFYFFIIKPFHKLVVKSMLKRTIKRELKRS